MNIVLADDSNIIIDSLLQLLENIEDVKIVKSCNNGISALNTIKEVNPDLAIIDIKMPGLSGIEVISELKKEKNSTVFIVYSFYATDYYKELAEKKGADFFISKSDNLEKIINVINQLKINKLIKNQSL